MKRIVGIILVSILLLCTISSADQLQHPIRTGRLASFEDKCGDQLTCLPAGYGA
ncbi:MAG TPA: hypothetical protein VMW63_00555 [Methanoregulaceae archaeon]|nr:hypothetical protein [Methanoregulaceae archaeon]